MYIASTQKDYRIYVYNIYIYIYIIIIYTISTCAVCRDRHSCELYVGRDIINGCYLYLKFFPQ